jgi:methionine salvage enolase-phosphatase E1
MRNKQINLIINEQDIRGVITSVTSAILIRQAKIRDETIEILNENLEEQTPEKILEIFRKLIKNNNRANQELENLSPLILAHGYIPEDFESPAEAEVLEDLPDLEENGLGVSGGSVEPVAVPSDAS